MRTRTPSDIKWLLNERAALAGEVRNLDKHIHTSQALLVQLATQTQLHQARLSSCQQQRQPLMVKMAALDSTLAQFDPRVNPAAAGTVNAWAGRYGVRGGQKKFLVDTLKAAAPGMVSTTELVTATIARFGLAIVTKVNRNRLRTDLVIVCRKLRAGGLVEQFPAAQVGGTAYWRWKSDAPTLADLHAQISSAP